jgi:hypothetical protein
LRDEIIEGFGKLHNERLHNMYSSSNIRMINSRMRWTGHRAHTGKKELYKQEKLTGKGC